MLEVSKDTAKGSRFLKRYTQYLTAADIRTFYTAYIQSKLEYNVHVCAGASKLCLEGFDRMSRKALTFMSDESMSRTLDTLDHCRNIGCVALMYRCIQGKWAVDKNMPVN